MSSFDRSKPPEEAALREAHEAAVQKALVIFNGCAVGAGSVRQKYETLLQTFFRKAFEDYKRNTFMEADMKCSNAIQNMEKKLRAACHSADAKLEQVVKRNVSALIDMKLEKHKNLREESRFYWKEITDGTYKFDRKESEVSELKRLTQQQLVEFFDDFIKVGATQKKTLSIRVYGSSHLSDLEDDKSSTEQSKYIHIDDIFTFRRTQPLYGSFRGGRTPTKL